MKAIEKYMWNFAKGTGMFEILKRNLLDSQPVGNDLWVSFGWMVLIILISYIFGLKVYRRV